MEHASKEIEKEKIRNRYKGVSPDLLEVIPAEERVDILQDDREKRVGVYVRVSTDDPRQTSSFELQRNHYIDLIDRYPNWHLYRIYADAAVIIGLKIIRLKKCWKCGAFEPFHIKSANRT